MVSLSGNGVSALRLGATSRPEVEIVGIRPWTTGASFTLDKVKVHTVIRARSKHLVHICRCNPHESVE